MLVLGLSCGYSTIEDDFIPGLPQWFGHDSAAVLVQDGTVVAAVEEERLNRLKHTNKFATCSTRACLGQAGITLDDVDWVAFFFEEENNDKELGLLYAKSPGSPLRTARSLISARLTAALDTELDPQRIKFVHHHTAHAYSTYYQSGFTDAIIAVIDGNGEDESVSLLSGRGDEIQLLRTFPPSMSLGHFYSTSIELLGYTMFDEYKVMGLAPHGDPARYRDRFRALYQLADDGGYQMEYSKFRSRFLIDGFRPRRQGEEFTQQHKDFAAALQETLESLALHIIGHQARRTGHRRLCVAGGVGLNCTMNGKLRQSGLFDEVFVHPASHDAGAALGAAMWVCRKESPATFSPAPLRHIYWGPTAGTEDAVNTTLDRWATFIATHTSTDICAEAAALIAEGAVIGWVQGRSEFGPRALGNRSILADPRPASNRERINDVVKKREGYRPFAPSVLAEQAHVYFDVAPNTPGFEYMVVVTDVRPEHRACLGAVTHVDGTARVHTVHRTVNERYWTLIDEFRAITGVPVLLNTSFNNHAEPIVQSAEDAIDCFLTTRLDYLVIGNRIITKRAVRDDDYLELIPRLRPAVGLRTRVLPAMPDRPARCTFEVYFRHTGGAVAAVSAELFATLLQADGMRNIRKIGVKAGETLAELQSLWEQRFLTLRPELSAEENI